MSLFLRPVLKKLFQAREGKDAEMVKPFLDHLEDLRWTLIKAAVTLAVTMMLSFVFRKNLMLTVERPLRLATGHAMQDLVGLAPGDSVNISISLAFYAGLILSFPLQLFYLAGFVLPALTPKEKSLVLPVIGVGFGLFLTGVLFCFNFVLPPTLHWLWEDQRSMGINPSWTAQMYFSFASQFVLIFGLSFELPVVVIALVKLGLLTAGTLRKTRAYAIVLILVAAAFIAPSPDPITMGVVAGPMLLLYELCIWIAWYLERRERRSIMRPTREE